MTNKQHLITPPPALVKQWDGHGKSLSDAAQILATQAAQWGWVQRGAANEAELQRAADQELEACLKWLAWESPATAEWVNRLRIARRPKPPSLKEQAQEALEKWADDEYGPGVVFHKGLDVGLLRRALEALPND